MSCHSRESGNPGSKLSTKNSGFPIETFGNDSIGLYLHIPFCDSKCHFCDFAAFVGQDKKKDDYVSAILTEAGFFPSHPVETLYLGGGTPTVLSTAQIDRLILGLKHQFDFSGVREATFEANPESATTDVLTAYLQHGFTRLSFGLQATQSHVLKQLGRLHTFETFLDAYGRARKLGFKNINIDLMYGLPSQTLNDWTETLNIVAELNPEHISAYGLKIEEGTKFSAKGASVDEDEEATFYLETSRFLKARGYRHYEISNFAKPGFESMHNLRYWRNNPTLGLGVSSASFMEGKRLKNISSLTRYMDAISSGQSAIEEQTVLSPVDQMREDLMLGLRLDEGVKKADLDELNVPLIKTFLVQNHAAHVGDRYHLTPTGWLLSNQLFQELV